MNILLTLFSDITHHNLFGLFITLIIYELSLNVYNKLQIALFHPVLVSVFCVSMILYIFNISYEDYIQSTTFLSILVSLATVSLAVPLYSNFYAIKQVIFPIIVIIFVVGFFSVFSAYFLGLYSGLDREVLMSLIPKTVTTPIAIVTTEKIGGIASLAPVFVLCNGILGAMIGPFILDKMKNNSHMVYGISLGIISHAVGTAKAFEKSEIAGSFAAVSMGLMAIIISFLLPLIFSFLTN